MATAKARKSAERTYDARPDPLDFRDIMFVATLNEVPVSISRAAYEQKGVPILDQGKEGACTGFGLATVANYLLRSRPRETTDLPPQVSPRMIYEMARRYDEWTGEDYSGSSARGAVKGWFKHGICAEEQWPFDPKDPGGFLDAAREDDARRRPLGAYFRVNHQDLVAMHSAIAQVGVLYATASVHKGWLDVAQHGRIVYQPSVEPLGGHAFAIVAYDEKGLWIQNSWGDGWGDKGFGFIGYDDWLANGSDVWVARLGVPVQVNRSQSITVIQKGSAALNKAVSIHELRPHVVSIGGDGQLKRSGSFSSTPEALADRFDQDIAKTIDAWPQKRILLYAHGGLVSEDSALQNLAGLRTPLLQAHVFPLAFIWHTDFFSTLGHVLTNAASLRKPEGMLDAALDFMLDRLDDALEPLARRLTGKLVWDDIKRKAKAASADDLGGVRLTLANIARLKARFPELEVHVAGHSAGAVLLGHLLSILMEPKGRNAGPSKPDIASCTLWAPGCSLDLFRETYLKAMKAKKLDRLALFTLTDQAEQDDDCAGIYHKSLLYLVSRAFEAPRSDGAPNGTPLLGMARFVKADAELSKLFHENAGGRMTWTRAPNLEDIGSPLASRAQHHGDFDNDPATLRATLAYILGRATVGIDRDTDILVSTTSADMVDRRKQLNARCIANEMR
ncbi:MAG: C1 family peptidase [Anaerolineae bacterium]